MEVELPPRDRPRPASPVPEDSSCAYELTPPEDPLPFEASFDERVTYARLHRDAHLRAAASLHCSVVAWCGLWDLVTYCGLAAVWRGEKKKSHGLCQACVSNRKTVLSLELKNNCFMN